MKIRRPPPRCKGCGIKIFTNGVKCSHVMVNGCEHYWCLVCWQQHAITHDREWAELSPEEKDKIINEA